VRPINLATWKVRQMTTSGSQERTDAKSLRTSKLLRARAVWITPVIITSIVIALILLAYMGSVVNPTGHLRHLPVFLVNEDQGADVGSERVNLGQQVESSLTGTPAVASRLSLKKMTLAQARHDMERNKAYATVVIPRGSPTRYWRCTASGPRSRRVRG
jgi:YhgE/Pip-like protein